MEWMTNISVSNVFGLVLLACAVVCAFGVRRFCRHKGYDEEKTVDVVYRAKVAAMALAIAGTVLVTDVVRF